MRRRAAEPHPLTRALVTGGTGRLGAPLVEHLREAGWSVVAAGSRDGDVALPAAAAALVERAAAGSAASTCSSTARRPASHRIPSRRSKRPNSTPRSARRSREASSSRAAAPHLVGSRGVVVMIEDAAAYQPWPLFPAHCAAKAAQAMLTRVLAKAMAPEVRVVGVAPGPVAVESGQEARRARETVLGRVGSPADVAAAIVYLAGASFVTGTTLVVDGGRLLQTGPGASP